MIRLLFLAALVTSSASMASNGREPRHEKVEICHKDKHVIEVDEHAVPAHLAHGDCLDVCPCNTPPECTCDADCSDGVFCNGAEVCTDGACAGGEPPCSSVETCSEELRGCEVPPECLQDSDCSDGLFCNGSELCLDGSCVTAVDEVCLGQVCDEALDLCITPPECESDANCSDGLFCTGHELCTDGRCVSSVAPCPESESCDEAQDACFTAEGEGEGEGEGEPEPSEGEGEPSEGEGEPEPSEGEGEGEGERGPVRVDAPDDLFISGSGLFACSSANYSGGSLLLFLGMALFAIRRRLHLTAAAMVMLMALPSAAEGLNRVSGPISSSDTAQTSSADTLPELLLQTSVGLDYSHAPVVLRDADFLKQANVVDHQFTGRVNAAFGLTDRLQLDASIPVSVVMGDTSPLNSGVPAGLQDPALGLRFRLTERDSFVRAALNVRSSLPSGLLSMNGSPVLGESLPTVSPGVLLAVGSDDASLQLDTSYTLRAPKNVADLRIGHTVNAALGARVNILEDRLWVLADLGGSFSAQPLLSNRPFLPLEATLGLRAKNGPLHGVVAVGSGLLPDVGTPDLRGMAFVGFDFDFTGKQEVAVAVQPAASPAPAPQEPPSDRDGDGIFDSDDACPDVPEDFDGFEDDDGCPEDQKVLVEKDRIVVLEPVYFFFDSDRIRPESNAVLSDVATAMLENREIALLSVEGHASSEGSSKHNKMLSGKRAAAVVRALVDKGVSQGRLVSVGFGEDRPIASNRTRAGREKNRRVEFIILERK